MKIILIVIFMIIASFNVFADNGYPSKPQCLKMGPYWKKNFDRCMDSLYRKVKPVTTQKEAEDDCKCVADGIVNSPTCDEFSTSANIAKLEASVAKRCLAFAKTNHLLRKSK